MFNLRKLILTAFGDNKPISGGYHRELGNLLERLFVISAGVAKKE